MPADRLEWILNARIIKLVAREAATLFQSLQGQGELQEPMFHSPHYCTIHGQKMKILPAAKQAYYC